MREIISTQPKIKPLLVDLRKDYDYQTLKRFYDELMLPNFPKEDELEPLDNWVEMFQEGLSSNFEEDYDFDTYYDYDGGGAATESGSTTNYTNNSNNSPKTKRYESSSSSSSSSSPSSGNQSPSFSGRYSTMDENHFSCDVDFHVVLALCPKELKQENQSDIMGGVVFEFYPSINCGCVTYLLVNSEYRGQGLAGMLLKEATERLMENGRQRGHLGGCNAIFLETNSSEKVNPEDDVMDPAKRHSIFHKLGIRLLDFDYIQPPLSNDSSKCKDLLLTCLITPNTPKQTLGREERYYLPSSLLKNFLMVFWDSCCSRLDYFDWRNDIDYQRMMDQIKRRERIPLLDLPWERPWTLLDIRDSHGHEDCQQLAIRFYNEVLLPNYAQNEELEPLESWLNMLENNGAMGQTLRGQQQQQQHGGHLHRNNFHLLVALRYPEDDINQQPLICGGLVFEYHGAVNCGLLTYVLVGGGPKQRAERMGRALIQRAVDILEQDAVENGHLAGCNAIFLETAQDQHKSDIIFEENADSIVEISHKHQFLEKMGWQRVDFSYIQPSLTYDKKPGRSLSLAILSTDRIRKPYLPNSLLLSFSQNFWKSESTRTGYWIDDDNDYKKMIDSLQRRKRIPLVPLTLRSRPFVLVNLAADYHADLLQSLWSALPQNHDIETLEQMQGLLAPSSYFAPTTLIQQNNSNGTNTHLVLAINYQDGSKPTIIGAVVFEYYLRSNCGIISHLFVKKSSSSLSLNVMHLNDDDGADVIVNDTLTSDSSNGGISMYRGWDIGKELLNEAVDILNKNARSRTHISGPNAIFLETPLNNQFNQNQNNQNINNNNNSSVNNLNTLFIRNQNENLNHQTNNSSSLIHNNNNSSTLTNQIDSSLNYDQSKYSQLSYNLALQQNGWLMVDIDYYQPPRGKVSKVGRPAILSVFYTSQLPTLPKDSSPIHSIVKNTTELIHNNANQGIKSTLPKPNFTISSITSDQDNHQYTRSPLIVSSLNNGLLNLNNNNNNNNEQQQSEKPQPPQQQPNEILQSQSYVPKDLIRSFLSQYWGNVYRRCRSLSPNDKQFPLVMPDPSKRRALIVGDEYYNKMVEQIKRTDKIHLLETNPKL
ncbi:hypothetical protein DFA_08765 [Cavenderia fasciculata]|uniref:N-acetyltransferase domain-containing protein n=1 Tax=Cavenderia fasciculata TaxID=261658 RepID=F4Q464_CACFS|nr:uncharacterized protein DFA_08765 [Cavenderia fasciculata]EGG17766.1 hypothetical protein DFA_08765 [Cavenderia fasciculata]|eukprot:XP_004356250.1 hypothetical protein DFA_08765 [Cavenderia fasciculata]